MKRFQVTVNGTAYDVQVEEIAPAAPPAVAAPAPPVPAAPIAPVPVAVAEPVAAVVPSASAPATPKPSGKVGSIQVISPMPGNIWEIRCAEGQTVASGDVLIILEAMKMENEIVASGDGKVAGIHVAKGDKVETGALLVSLN